MENVPGAVVQKPINANPRLAKFNTPSYVD